MKSLIRYFFEYRLSLNDILNCSVIYKGERWLFAGIRSTNNIEPNILPYNVLLKKDIKSNPIEVESIDIYICVI